MPTENLLTTRDLWMLSAVAVPILTAMIVALINLFARVLVLETLASAVRELFVVRLKAGRTK